MDYKSIDVIARRFNDSVYEFAKVKASKRIEDDTAIQSHTNNCISSCYQALEWALKNIIHDKYNGPNRNSVMRGSIHDMIRASGTVVDLSKIDVELLKRSKREKRNNLEHEGITPSIVDVDDILKQIEKIIRLIDEEVILKSVEDFDSLTYSPWDKFYSACSKFEAINHSYVLLIDDVSRYDSHYLSQFSNIKWNMIIDMDINSQESGFYYKCFSSFELPIEKVDAAQVIDSNFFSAYNRSHYHYFLNSYNGSGNVKTENYRQWNREYSNKFNFAIKYFSSTFVTNKTTLVILSRHKRYVNFVCETFERYFGDSLNIVIVDNDDSVLQEVAEDYGGVHVQITISQIAEGIHKFASNIENVNISLEQITVPFIEKSLSETSGVIDKEFRANLEEDFEIVHKELDFLVPEIKQNKRDFLSGQEAISWFGLRNDYDKKHPSLRSAKRIVREFISNGKGVYEIIHEPGCGGTTFGRRLAWEFHNDVPTLVLKRYRGSKTVSSLIQLHQQTRSTILVVIEVPIAMTLDDVQSFYNYSTESSGTRPMVFIVVRRGVNHEHTITDWGASIHDIIFEYSPFLDEYEDSGKISKKRRELDSIDSSSNSYLRTPFYIGLIVFEDQFYALRSYIESFLSMISSDSQKRALLHLSVMHKYTGDSLHSSLLKSIFVGDNYDSIFSLLNYLPQGFESLLRLEVSGNIEKWQPRHYLFSEEILDQINSYENEQGRQKFLADSCMNLIEDFARERSNSEYNERLLQNLFIGSAIDRAGSSFTSIINDISALDEIERVFKALVDFFPDNAHYCSHLARFYAYRRRNFAEALRYSDRAITLSEAYGRRDPLLYHIKGMCLRNEAYDYMDKIRRKVRFNDNKQLIKEDLDYLHRVLIPKAEDEFEKSREVAVELNRINEYGYVAHIQLLVRAIDFGAIISNQDKVDFLSSQAIKDPYLSWIDLAEILLDDVKRLIGQGNENQKVEECENSLLEFYGKYSEILQNLNNQLTKGNNIDSIKRQISRVYLRRRDKTVDQDTLNRIKNYMEENIEMDPSNNSNYNIWLSAVRGTFMSISEFVSTVSVWHAQTQTVQSAYYLYIAKVINGLEGYSDDLVESKELIRFCQKYSSIGSNKTFIHEWFGTGFGVKQIVNWKNKEEEELRYVEGYVTEYINDGFGYITVNDLLRVFFNPSRSGIRRTNLNSKVKLFIGFSYDGVRADDDSIHVL
jgi:hypothetical protein